MNDTYTKQKECDDFYRFLRKMLRGRQDNKEILLNLIVPIEIAIFTLSYAVCGNMEENLKIIVLIMFAIFLSYFLMNNILDVKTEIYFLEDYIEILFGEHIQGTVKEV